MTVSFARWKYEVIAQHFKIDYDIIEEMADSDVQFNARTFHAAPTYDLVDFPCLFELNVDCDKSTEIGDREFDSKTKEAVATSIICREILEDVLKLVNYDVKDSHDLCMELMLDIISELACKEKKILVSDKFNVGNTKQRTSLMNSTSNGLKRFKLTKRKSLELILRDCRGRQDILRSLISEKQVELENIKLKMLCFEETSKARQSLIEKIKREIGNQQHKPKYSNPTEVRSDKLECVKEDEMTLIRNLKINQVHVGNQIEDVKIKIKTVKSKIAEKERLIKSNKGLIKEIKQEISSASLPNVLKLNDILVLKFKEENENSSNYHLCLRSFLQSDAMEEVKKLDDEVIFKFRSSEELEKLLISKCVKMVEWNKISKLPQRAGFVPSKLCQDFGLLIYLEETSLLRKSIVEVEQEVVSCQGEVEIRSFGFAARFPTLLSCLQTLTNRELNSYHRVLFMKEAVQFLGTAGDVKFFNGKVCLMEKDFLRLCWKSEVVMSEIAVTHFVTGLSNFMRNANVENVMLDWDSRVVVTFSSQEYLENLLQEHCTSESSSVSKLSKLPVNWSFISTDLQYSVMCGQDADVRDFFTIDNNALQSHNSDEILSKSRSFPFLSLTSPDIRAFYPDIKLNDLNFVHCDDCKKC